jgi:serine/threonine protein phosphatase PrpC
VRISTRHLQFSVSQNDDAMVADTILQCVADDEVSIAAHKGELFVVLEGSGDLAKQRTALQLVMRTMRKTFYENNSFSVQSSLRRAIVAANHALYEYNVSLPVARRCVLGMSAIVIKGTDVFAAQILPGQIYVYHQSELRAIPIDMTWRNNQNRVGSLTGVSTNLLGGSLSVEPEFYRDQIALGDALILATSNIASILPKATVIDILTRETPSAMVLGLRALCEKASITSAYGVVLLIDELVIEKPSARTGSFSSITQQLMMATDNTGLWVNSVVDWVRGLFYGREESRFTQSMSRWRLTMRNEQQRVNRKPPEVPYSPNPIPHPAPIDLGDDIELQAARMARRDGALSGNKSAMRVIDATQVEVPSTPVDTDYAKQMGYRTQITEPIRYGELIGSLAQNLFTWRWIPRKNTNNRRMQAVKRSAGLSLSYRKQAPPFPWAMFTAMVALVAVSFFYGTNVARENRLQRGENSLKYAETAVQSIYESIDEREALQRIELARTMLVDLEQTGIITATTSNRQRYLTMVTRIEKAEVITQRRSFLTDVAVVAKHPIQSGVFTSVVVPPPASTVENSFNFSQIYLHDGNAGVLYKVPREGGEPSVVLRPNSQIGDLQISRVHDIAWRFDSVIAVAQSIDNGPFIYMFRNGNDWNYSILAGSLEWSTTGRTMRVQTFNGNLYLWGVTPANVLRYLSTQFGDFPEPWIQNDGGQILETAIDMGIDGRIYLLMPNGTIQYLRDNQEGLRGYEKSLPIPDITPPLQSAARLVITGDAESGSFFILDNYFGRIIQIEKRTGRFIQQITVPSDSEITLDNLTALVIDENQARPILYFINGGTLYRAPMPDPPLPFNQRVDSVVLPTKTPDVP